MPLTKTYAGMAYGWQDGDVEGGNEVRGTTRYRPEGGERECENECEEASFGLAEQCDNDNGKVRMVGLGSELVGTEIFSAMSTRLADLRILAATASVVVVLVLMVMAVADDAAPRSQSLRQELSAPRPLLISLS